MSDLRELYQEVILDHSRRPRNHEEVRDATHHAEGYNPLCGDRLTVYLGVQDGKIRDVGFRGSGCAISQASASLMLEHLKGKSVEDAEQLFQAMHSLLAGTPPVAEAELGKLCVFSGVRDFPTRIKCATLAWHTLRAALRQDHHTIKTETD